jgi:hypothetical protein
MRDNMVSRISSLLWVTVCFSIASCASQNAQKSSGKGNPRKFSREQILEAANGEARREGLDLKKFDITYDVGNAAWKPVLARIEAAVHDPAPFLKGHDYQVVIYRSREAIRAGTLYIFVDRNTCKVVKEFVEQ